MAPRAGAAREGWTTRGLGWARPRELGPLRCFAKAGPRGGREWAWPRELERLRCFAGGNVDRCDEEIAKTLKDRDYRLRDVGALHAELESGNARKEVLTENQITLEHEIGNLTADLATETQNRAEEKAENEQTIADSEEGVKAVQQAMDILSHA